MFQIKAEPPAQPRPRRFPPPWSVEGQPACFVVRDANGQQFAYVYFEDECLHHVFDRDQSKIVPLCLIFCLSEGLVRWSSEMCDFSLQSVKSRPANVGDKLTTRSFGTGTR